MKNIVNMRNYFGKTALGLALTLIACYPAWGQDGAPSFSELMSHLAQPPAQPASEALAKAAEAVSALRRMDLAQASKSINEALQLDDRNSYLHFLNGFIYHVAARRGDSEKNDLAVEGYRQALRLDPGNWIAQEFLGLAYLDLKRFPQAKEQFAQALLLYPNSTASIRGLMVASYLTGDAPTACAMADQFRKNAPHPSAGFVRSSIAVYASCGDFAQAELMRATYGQFHPDPLVLARVDQRLAQWKSFYTAHTGASLAQGAGSPAGFVNANLDDATIRASARQAGTAFSITNRKDVPPPQILSAPAATPGAAPASVQEQAVVPGPAATPTPAARPPGMVLVDVVMVATQEVNTMTRGVNLLNALTLQLGSATAPALSLNYDSASGHGTVITKAVTIPALAYSLNIANSNGALNQVLARPTLAAIEGHPSEFFSGTNLSAGVLSTSTLGSASVVPIDKRFGVKLAVTPTFLPNGMIQMKVDAERTFLNADNNNSALAYRFDISETSTNANVVMKVGDTLVLSGLSEKQTARTRDGVPFLQDIPLLQYAFSNRRDVDYQRSVLMLITPRMPVYTATADGTAVGAVSDSVKALRDKIGLAERMPANSEAILNHLKTTDVFREFRQGDVAMQPWDRSRTTIDRLGQALGFLYY